MCVGNIHSQSHSDLSQVFVAGSGLGLSFCSGKHRQQQRRQDCNNGDDHEEFDEGEAPGMTGTRNRSSIAPSEAHHPF